MKDGNIAQILLTSLIYLDGILSLVSSNEEFGQMNLLELEKLQYEVEIVPIPVKESEIRQEESEKSTDEPSVVVTSRRGQKYRCLLPTTPLKHSSYSTRDEDEEESFTNISSLLKPLKGNCLLINDGWWSYRYCHGDSVTQFHLEGGKIAGDIVYLGHYEKEEEWNEEKLNKAMDQRAKRKTTDHNVLKLPSHNVKYVNGTVCEITNKPRSVNVKVTCSPYHSFNEIIRVIEEDTCNYSIIVHSPLLCDHPLFMVESKLGLSGIQCSPVLSEVKYNRYMAFLNKEAVKEEEKSSSEISDDTIPPKTPKDTVPLLNILEMLTNSVMKEVSLEVTTDKESTKGSEEEEEEGGGDDDSDEEISEELDELIDELVTNSLNKVFGLDSDKNEEETGQSSVGDAPGGSKSKAISSRDEHSENKADIASATNKQTSKEGRGGGGMSKRHTFLNEINEREGNQGREVNEQQESGRDKSLSEETGQVRKDVNLQQKDNQKEEVEFQDQSGSKDITRRRSNRVSSAASVLTSLLQDLLNDGYLEFSESSADLENERKKRKKQQKLEEHYNAPWDVSEEEESE